MKIAQTQSLKTIARALKKYSDLIAPTYGPAGKKVLIAHNEFNLKAVDDGFEASKEFELENEFENAVVMYIKEATRKTNERAGDGTTTAGILMNAIFQESLGDMESPLAVLKKSYHGEVKEIEKGVKEAVAEIKKQAKKIKTKEELYKIAYNSYNNEAIAHLIAETLHKIGADGLLSIGDSATSNTEVEMVKGLELEKGYVSPYFINSEKEEVVIDNPYILTIQNRIESFTEVSSLLQQLLQLNEKRLVIIAEGFGEDMLNKSILVKIQGFNLLLLETPGYGDTKVETLVDIATLTGGNVIDLKITKATDITIEKLGSAKKIVSQKEKTIVIDGHGHKENIHSRIENLQMKLGTVTAGYSKDALGKRIAALKGGMALIKVGATTENEQKAIKAKVEDSVNATLLAFKEGIVKGAGKTYAQLKTSSAILNRALQAPLHQLKENGAEYLDDNVTDPAGVLIAALETGCSIACGLLEIDGIITTKREEKEDTKF